jgi:Tfp pilus assembly protein PilN
VSRDFSTNPERPPRSRFELALVAAGLAALAWSAFGAHASWRDARDKRARVEEARRELAGALERVPHTTPSSSDAAFAQQALLSLEAAPPVVLAALATVLPPDVRLDGLALDYGGALQLQLQVVARDAAAYDRFLSQLEASPRFGSVSPGEENRDGEVRAVVRASFGSASP